MVACGSTSSPPNDEPTTTTTSGFARLHARTARPPAAAAPIMRVRPERDGDLARRLLRVALHGVVVDVVVGRTCCVGASAGRRRQLHRVEALQPELVRRVAREAGHRRPVEHERRDLRALQLRLLRLVRLAAERHGVRARRQAHVGMHERRTAVWMSDVVEQTCALRKPQSTRFGICTRNRCPPPRWTRARHTTGSP